MSDLDETIDIYVEQDSESTGSDSEVSPHDITVLIQEIIPEFVYQCSLCDCISDYRKISYFCVDCWRDYGVVTRICRPCISIETLLGRTRAHPEWSTTGELRIKLHHLHKPEGSETAHWHRLYLIPPARSETVEQLQTTA